LNDPFPQSEINQKVMEVVEVKKSTKTLRTEDVVRNWYTIDAEGVVLGRLASKIAMILMGKEKTTYSPNIDGGDYVVVTNATKFAVTGNKMEDKKYHHYSGYKGGLTTRNLADMLERKPTDVIRLAVKNMLPKNKLAAQRLNRLKIYITSEHDHAAQKPTSFTL